MRLIITILLFACAAHTHAQLIKGTAANLSTLTVGGTPVTRIATTWGLDKSAGTLASMAALADAINKNTTTLYTGWGLRGSGTSKTDPLRLDRDIILETLFYQSTLNDIKTWRQIEGMIFWARDSKDFLFWRNGTLQRVVSEGVK